MGLLSWIVLGGIAGWIVSIINGTDGQQGIVGNIVKGIIGALLGGFIVSAIGGSGINEFSLYSLLVAIGGGLLLSWLLRKTT